MAVAGQSSIAMGQFGTCNKLNRKEIMQMYDQAWNLKDMCDRVLCFNFVRTPEPVVIGDGITVSQIWPVVSTADDEKFNTRNHMN